MDRIARLISDCKSKKNLGEVSGKDIKVLYNWSTCRVCGNSARKGHFCPTCGYECGKSLSYGVYRFGRY